MSRSRSRSSSREVYSRREDERPKVESTRADAVRSRDSRSPPRKAGFGENGKTPHSDDLHSVVVNQIPSQVKDRDIWDKFEKWGKIGDVFLPLNRSTGRHRGFGFVRFFEERAQQDCLDDSSKDGGIEIEGEKVNVAEAKQRPRPGRDGWDPDRRRRFEEGRGGDRGGDRGGYRDRSPARDRGYNDRRDDYRGGYRRDSRSPPRRRSRSPVRRRSPSPRRRDDYEDRRRSDDRRGGNDRRDDRRDDYDRRDRRY